MNNHYGKSRFARQKQSTKSGIEDNTPEEEELKKYKELIERLDNEFKNTTGKIKGTSMYSNANNNSGPSGGNNKSSYMRRTASKTKEVLNDRDFLINFMNNDTMPILPKNMHLLSDNDTNQSISDETKYKNLADLMIDDKETVVESNFVRNVEEKLILKLYTALSRKSKEIFMDENHEEQSKNRILFHKLNEIKIPKFEINDPSLNSNYGNYNINDSIDSDLENELNNNINNGINIKKMRSYSEKSTLSRKFNNKNINNNQQNDKKFNINQNNPNKLNNNNNIQNEKKNSVDIIISNNINKNNNGPQIDQKDTIINMKVENQNNLNIQNNLEENKQNNLNNNIENNDDNLNLCENIDDEENGDILKFNENCKYNKKCVEKIIKIPKLGTYNPYRDKYHSRRFHKNRPKNLWDPEIDADFLAYINHNIICIEDIYNQDKEKIIDNSREEDIKPIEAKEVFYDNGTEQNNSFNNEIENREERMNKSMDNNSQRKEGSRSGEEDENDIRTKNKFCEFKDRHPNLIEISLLVDPSKQKINNFHNELKDIYYSKINEIGEYSEDAFPPKGVDLKNIKIYRYAVNNERNEEVSTDSFTILSTIPNTPPPQPTSPKKNRSNSKRKKNKTGPTRRRKVSYDILESKRNRFKFDENGILKRQSHKIENGDKKEFSINENITNNLDNTISMIEKEIKHNEGTSTEKKSFTDNLNNMFNQNESIKFNEEENNFENNDNNDISKNVENNNFNENNDENNENKENNHENNENKENKENSENINLKLNEDNDIKSDSNSNISSSKHYKDESKDNILNLSFSRNSGD